MPFDHLVLTRFSAVRRGQVAGSVLTGPILVLGTPPTGGQRGVFVWCAVLTAMTRTVLLVVPPTQARH